MAITNIMHLCKLSARYKSSSNFISNVDSTNVLVAYLKPRIGHYGHVGSGH